MSTSNAPQTTPEVTPANIPLPSNGHIYRAYRILPDGRITDTWLLFSSGLLHLHYDDSVPAHWVGAPFHARPATRAAAMLDEDGEDEEEDAWEVEWDYDVEEHLLWLLDEVYALYLQ